jgi:hypothetical protein
MMDEKLLTERLTDAASAQDNLLPRALSEDLAAGHRRLRRHRLLAGAGVIGSAAAVAVLVVGVTSGLGPNASPLPGDPAPASTGPTPGGPRPDPAFTAKLQGILAQHFDPARKHLTFDAEPIWLIREPGRRVASGGANWTIAGQKGQGTLYFTLNGPNTANRCGGLRLFVCHSTPMPGGGTAMIGRQDEVVEISYRQPDGETVYLTVNTSRGNEPKLSLHAMGITDDELKAFVADSELNLPPMTPEEKAAEQKLQRAAPTDAELQELPLRYLSGGQASTTYIGTELGGNRLVRLSWVKPPTSATIEVGVDAKLTSNTCQAQLSVPGCAPLTLPDGQKVEYYEGVQTSREGQKYVLGATFTQPDGDLSSVQVFYPGKKLPAGAITKAQVLAMVTDPVLDK